MLDEVYERYLNRKGGSTKHRKRAKRGLAIEDTELMEVFYVINVNTMALLFVHVKRGCFSIHLLKYSIT